MRFKRLEMVGFKSFAGRTVLDFEPGVTAIVGPNGCGKSNISDAVRWVLGEQSARSLRGARMEDVIFNGTAERQPIGMAEVSLTMSNTDGVLPIEYSEITVTRQLFRSGESRYLLNRNPCRLRDISELFMNTGLGASEYSIIEQGKMDLVLSSKPEERRVLFEEAAGITKYKAKKKEALRKLESTDDNLRRLDDIIKEVKRQINSIKRQVAKAQKYKEIYAELAELETDVSLADYKRHLDEIGRQQAESDSIRGKVESGEAGLRRLEESVASLRRDSAKYESRIEEVQGERIGLQGKIDASRARLDANRNWIEEISHTTSRGTDELEEINRRVSQLEDRRRSVDEELGAITGKCDALRKRVEGLEASLRGLDGAISADSERLEGAKGETLEVQSRLSSLNSRLGAVRARQREIALSKRRSAVEIEEAAARRAALERGLGEEKAALEGLRERRASLNGEKERTEGERAQRIAVLEDASKDALNLEKALSRVSSKAELVGEINAPIALDEVLSADRKLVAHVIGPLSELIEVEEGYADAVVNALADRYSDLIADDFASSCDIARALTRRGLREIALSPLGAGMPEGNGPHGPWPPGARPAIDVVRADGRVRNLVERLLAGVVIVDDIDAAIALWPECRGVFSIATREGQFISSAGRIVLGVLGRGRGWISEQIEALRAEETILAEKLSGSEARRLDAELAAGELAKEFEALQSELRHLEIEFYSGERDLSRLEGEVLHSGEEELAFTSRLQELEEEAGALSENENGIVAELQTCREEEGVLERTIAGLQSALSEKQAEKESVGRRLGDVRVELATLMGSRSNIEVSHREIITALEERKKALTARIGDVDTTRTRVQSLLAENESLARRLEELEARKCELEEEASRLSSERGRFHSRAEADDEKQRQLQRGLDELWERQKDLDVRIAGLKPEAEGILQRVREEYGVELDRMLCEGAPVATEGLDGKRSRILGIKENIKRLGPVNLGAIDEHDELSERFAFLEEQKKDLIEAKDALNRAIIKINQTTKRMFFETFEAIRVNFKEIYKKLFGGGKSDLLLIDESDVLESGIEIVARPPGKKLQSVSLLSGGERAMTAMALLFALFKVKPSPFCVLDEIDAPLDEANIGRFVDLLTEFVVDSQFIIITHNKRTIEMADVLYGITMEEFGVSRVVSVKFTDEKSTEDAGVEARQ